MAKPNLIPPSYSPQQIQWFWSKVPQENPNNCWPYLGEIDDKGYGIVRFSNLHRRDKAHRIAYWLTFGRWPAEFMCMHKCDNPCCVNPYHLKLGSQLDNIADMKQKGRAASGENNGNRKHPESVPRGERNGWSKLTAQQVIEIRKKYATGHYIHQQLADEYSIHRRTVGQIISGKRWAHISLN